MGFELTSPLQTETLLSRLHDILLDRRQTLSTAESCTGGLVASLLATRPGISKVFLGGVVTYSNELKSKILGVPESLLACVGAVSQPVALAMARGAVHRFGSQWSVSLTGVAGPDGGSVDKPVGTVFIAVIGPGVECVERVHAVKVWKTLMERGIVDGKDIHKASGGNHGAELRMQIQRAAAHYSLEILLNSFTT